MTDFLTGLLSVELIWVLIPIAWFIVKGVVEITKAVQRHQERMAMIRRGMHPDAPEQVGEEGDVAGSARIPADARQTADYRR